jgi:hypothetical protein
MTAHLRYLRYVLRHKWYVLVAGLRTGAPLWRLLIHDWSKFTPSEWGAYVAKFYGGPMTQERIADYHGDARDHRMRAGPFKEQVDADFDRAWLHHQKRNRHHWQYWVLMEDDPKSHRWAITSADGGMRHHAITDYGSDESGRVRFDVDALDITKPGSDDRYRVAARLVRDATRYRALPMPDAYVREMVADWMGAGRAITGRWEVREWYAKNAEKMVLHPDTRSRVGELLGAINIPALREAA